MGFRPLFFILQESQNQKQTSISHFTSAAKPKTEFYFSFYKCRKIKNRTLFLILQVSQSQKQSSISHFARFEKRSRQSGEPSAASYCFQKLGKRIVNTVNNSRRPTSIRKDISHLEKSGTWAKL